MFPFYGWGSTASKLQGHYKDAVYFLPVSSQEFLVLIWPTSEGWKIESNFESPSGFEHGDPTFFSVLWFKLDSHLSKKVVYLLQWKPL